MKCGLTIMWYTDSNIIFREAPRARGSIKFCTTGVLLRMLEMDPALTEVSHLILDEIHERDTISDFAITILKDIIPKVSCKI